MLRPVPLTSLQGLATKADLQLGDCFQAELENIQRLAMLGTVAASLAHEINNILTPVLGYAQLAARQPDDRELIAKTLNQVIQGVETATRIVHSVLGLARGADEADTANVLHALEAAVTCLGRDPKKDRIELVIQVPAETTVKIRPLALQQVFMNLLLNAYAALKASGKALKRKIAISCIERSDGTTAIRVSDSGPGIPEDVARRIFQPFASVKSPRARGDAGKQSGGGTGLGLLICRQLVEAAQGTIVVSSQPGDGATFTVALPTHLPKRAKAS